MFFKILKNSLILISSIYLYKYFYEKLLKDDDYLQELANESNKTEKEQNIKQILFYAKEAELQSDYKNASDYYFVLVESFNCSIEEISSLILKEETKILFSNKFNFYIFFIFFYI